MIGITKAEYIINKLSYPHTQTNNPGSKLERKKASSEREKRQQSKQKGKRTNIMRVRRLKRTGLEAKSDIHPVIYII